MKLLKILSIRYLLSSVIVVILLGVALNRTLSYMATEETDEKLLIMYNRLTQQLKEGKSVGSMPPYFEVKTIPFSADKLTFEDSDLKDFKNIENEGVRLMTATFNYGNITYLITVRELKVESDDLFETIFILVVVAILLLVVVLYLVNYRITKSIWKNFYENLERLKNFSLQDQKALILQPTKIVEFKELNTILESLTNQVITDYLALKQFTEDASHEIQTPLAVIYSKVEALLNNNQLAHGQLEILRSIDDSVSRLSRLNKNLILLTKLENKQFMEISSVSFRNLLDEKLKEFQELIELKKIKISCNFNDELVMSFNPTLADILITNLLSNAINHNSRERKIRIEINGNQLLFANSGESELKKPQAMFKRFYKEDPSSKSVGLGLAIVKKICDNYSISIDYSFEAACHRFTLTFPL